MLIRLIINPLNGDYSTLDLEVKTAGDLISYFKDPNIQIWQDGRRLSSDEELSINSVVIIKRAPGAISTIIAVATIAVSVGILVVAGIALYQAFQKTPKIGDIQTSPSLRGSQNQARKNQKYPILLGKHRIYPDLAALPYTEYKDNEQYLIQLFNFGYKDIKINTDAVKIGDTELTKYSDYSFFPGLELYPQRVIESAIQVELEEDAITRTTCSNTKRVSVGLSSPSGLYRLDDNGKKQAITVGIKIEWSIKSANNWHVAFDEKFNANNTVWRKSYEFKPVGDSNNQYDIKVSRTTSTDDDISVVDTIYFDVIRCILTGEAPSNLVDDSMLYGLKIKASKQLNGIIDSINAEGQLQCRTYNGSGTGPSAWSYRATSNPAAAIIYLLTDKLANPRPISDNQIEWAEFEYFYKFCEEKHFECNAWITSDQTISDLIDYIAISNLAQIRKSNAKVGIIVDNGRGSAVQLFTPHNANDFSEEINLKIPTNALKIKFVDKDAGYAEIERYVSLDENNEVVFDKELDKTVDVTEINLFGVTSSNHASKVAKVRLLELARRNRVFKFKTDIEGLLCEVGDVVLLNHNSFLIGSGEGRVTDVIYNNGNIIGINIDNEIKLSSGVDYGCSIRTAEGVYENIAINLDSLNPVYIEFKQPLNFTISLDDIVAIGPLNSETIKVLVTGIERSDTYECTITAVDLFPEIYDEGLIPPFNSGLTIPSDGDEIGTGVNPPPIYNAPVVMPNTYSNFEFAITSDLNPPLSKETYFKYGDYFIQFKNHLIVEDDLWKPEQPTPNVGQYVWMRMLSKTGEYVVVRLTGKEGEKAKHWSCVFNPSSYVNTPRRLNGFNIQVLYDSSNIEKPIFSIQLTTPEITEAERGYRIHPEYDNVIEILPGATPPFVEAKVTLLGAGGGSKILKCYGTDTAEMEPMYLGKTEKMPPLEAELGYRFINGDWVFYAGTTDANYQLGHVYQKHGNAWIETIEFEKLIAVQDDAKSLMKENIFAQVIFAESILTTNMLVSGKFIFRNDKDGERSTFEIDNINGLLMKYGAIPTGIADERPTVFHVDKSGNVTLGYYSLGNGLFWNNKNKQLKITGDAEFNGYLNTPVLGTGLVQKTNTIEVGDILNYVDFNRFVSKYIRPTIASNILTCISGTMDYYDEQDEYPFYPNIYKKLCDFRLTGVFTENRIFEVKSDSSWLGEKYTNSGTVISTRAIKFKVYKILIEFGGVYENVVDGAWMTEGKKGTYDFCLVRTVFNVGYKKGDYVDFIDYPNFKNLTVADLLAMPETTINNFYYDENAKGLENNSKWSTLNYDFIVKNHLEDSFDNSGLPVKTWDSLHQIGAIHNLKLESYEASEMYLKNPPPFSSSKDGVWVDGSGFLRTNIY